MTFSQKCEFLIGIKLLCHVCSLMRCIIHECSNNVSWTISQLTHSRVQGQAGFSGLWGKKSSYLWYLKCMTIQSQHIHISSKARTMWNLILKTAGPLTIFQHSVIVITRANRWYDRLHGGITAYIQKRYTPTTLHQSLTPLISMQYSRPLLGVGNWWRYLFSSRWWQMPLPGAIIWLEHVIIVRSVQRSVHSVSNTVSWQSLKEYSRQELITLSKPPTFTQILPSANSKIIQSNHRCFSSLFYLFYSSFWRHPTLNQPPTSPKAQSMLTNKVA